MSEFHTTVRRLCAANDWSIDSKGNNRITMQFRGSNSGSKRVTVIDSSPMETVMVSGDVMFRGADIPEVIPAVLLNRNWDITHGFWCMTEHEGVMHFLCMARVPLCVLNAEQFGGVVRQLVAEMETIENTCRKKGML